jgi:rRNA maturation endonuclease Nob1
MIELIRTYTSNHRGVVVNLAYRCTRCERIFPDITNREASYFHDCKGKK